MKLALAFCFEIHALAVNRFSRRKASPTVTLYQESCLKKRSDDGIIRTLVAVVQAQIVLLAAEGLAQTWTKTSQRVLKVADTYPPVLDGKQQWGHQASAVPSRRKLRTKARFPCSSRGPK